MQHSDDRVDTDMRMQEGVEGWDKLPEWQKKWWRSANALEKALRDTRRMYIELQASEDSKKHKIKHLSMSSSFDDCCLCITKLFAEIHGNREEKADARNDPKGYQVFQASNCLHAFHRKCLNRLFGAKNAAFRHDHSEIVSTICPLCRKELVSTRLSLIQVSPIPYIYVSDEDDDEVDDDSSDDEVILVSEKIKSYPRGSTRAKKPGPSH